MRAASLLVAIAMLGALTSSSDAAAPTPPRMVRVPSGVYRPMYAAPSSPGARVASFWLDRDEVTRGDFLGFVRAQPQWRSAELEASSAADLRRPVTGVSWRAAQAYCEAQNKRLPTLVEWEYAAAASATARNATSDTAFVQWLITTYTTRPTTPRTVDEGVVNAYDVRGMHDLAWEWVADPNERFAVQSHHHHDHSAASGHDMSCAGAALGAGDPRNYPAFLRSAVRSALEETTTLSTLGFRCAA